MTGTDGSLPDACTAALTNAAKWGIFLKAPQEGIEKGIEKGMEKGVEQGIERGADRERL